MVSERNNSAATCLSNLCDFLVTDFVGADVRNILEMIFFVFLSGIISFFGAIGNLMNIFILCKQGLKDSINISLLGLAMSDLGSVVTLVWMSICFNPFFRYSSIPFESVDIQYLSAGWPHVCFARITSWITAFITFERCLCVASPMRVRQIITPRRTTVVLIVIFLVMLGSVSPVYYAIHISSFFHASRNLSLEGLVYSLDGATVEYVSFSISVSAQLSSFALVIICTLTLIANLLEKSRWRRSVAVTGSGQGMSGRDRRSKLISFLRCHNSKSTTPRINAVMGMSYGITLTLFGLNLSKKEEDNDILTQKYRDARLAHMRQDLKKADDLYHECLKLASQLVESKSITEEKFLTARTLMYDGLADIAMQTGNLETAELLYKDTMKGCLQHGMALTHNTIVEISLKLASIYAIIGKKTEAEAGYMFCIQTQTPKLKERVKQWQDKKTPTVLHPEMDETEKDTAALLGMALGSYGRFLLYEKRYQEALGMFEKALMYAKHVLGYNSDQYIVVLNDLATLYIVTNHYQEAENLLLEGINLSSKYKLKEGAALYSNLGAIHIRNRNIEDAIKSCQAGLEYAKKFDHKTAYSMAESCLKKAATLMSASSDKKTNT
ncbi:tetratricopeptide repeat protein 19 mitochondrial [Biomphalaria glabrata]